VVTACRMITRLLNDELEGLEREMFAAYLKDYPRICVQIRGKPQRTWPPKSDNPESSGQKADY
jgi:hypothetical protein